MLSRAVLSNAPSRAFFSSALRSRLGICLFFAACSFGQVTHVVAPGTSLQVVLDRAVPGDTVVLQAGATYTGNFVLRPKAVLGTITIRSSATASLPPSGTRLDIVSHRGLLARIVTPMAQPAVRALAGVNGYVFHGIEFTVASGVYAFDIFAIGSGAETSTTVLPRNLTFRQCWFHGDPTLGAKRGIALNGGATTVVDSVFTDFFAIGQDTQAMAGWNGSGPFILNNNRIEATGQGILFGGARPAIAGLVPSDIQVNRNLFTRPLEWRTKYPIKNHLEFKNGQNAVVNGNVFENNWMSAQSGFAVLFTVRTCEAGDYHWAVVRNIRFTYNVFRNSDSGINIMGRDDVRSNCAVAGTGTVTATGTTLSGASTFFTTQLKVGDRVVVAGQTRIIAAIDNDFQARLQTALEVAVPSSWRYFSVAGQTSRITIQNNLLLVRFRGIQILSGADRLTIENNTILSASSGILFSGQASTNLIFRSNIFAAAIAGDGIRPGTAVLNFYAPNSIFSGNILFGFPTEQPFYPAGNFFPANATAVGFVDYAGGNYALAPTSPFRSTVLGTPDPGVNFPNLALAAQTAALGPVNLTYTFVQ